MTATNLRLWTVDEYHRMIEAEILTEEDKVELLEGEILAMSPQKPPHAATTDYASEYLNSLLVGLAKVRVQLPVTLCPNSEPEPDIAVVRIDRRNYFNGHPTPDDIFLLVEVADTTLNKDLNVKAPAYGKVNIPEYWVLDLNTRQVYVFREPNSKGYAQKFTLDETQTLRLFVFEDVEITVKDLFPY
jgi:Uma2 family endonuclease